MMSDQNRNSPMIQNMDCLKAFIRISTPHIPLEYVDKYSYIFYKQGILNVDELKIIMKSRGKEFLCSLGIHILDAIDLLCVCDSKKSDIAYGYQGIEYLRSYMLMATPNIPIASVDLYCALFANQGIVTVHRLRMVMSTLGNEFLTALGCHPLDIEDMIVASHINVPCTRFVDISKVIHQDDSVFCELFQQVSSNVNADKWKSYSSLLIDSHVVTLDRLRQLIKTDSKWLLNLIQDEADAASIIQGLHQHNELWKSKCKTLSENLISSRSAVPSSISECFYQFLVSDFSSVFHQISIILHNEPSLCSLAVIEKYADSLVTFSESKHMHFVGELTGLEQFVIALRDSRVTWHQLNVKIDLHVNNHWHPKTNVRIQEILDVLAAEVVIGDLNMVQFVQQLRRDLEERKNFVALSVRLYNTNLLSEGSGKILHGDHGKFGFRHSDAMYNGRPVALRCCGSDPGSKEAMKREILKMMYLRHPNIVECYGSGDKFDKHHMWITELSQCSLYDVILKTGRYTALGSGKGPKFLSMDWKLSILTDVAKGLRFIHAHDTVHGDVCLQNILLFVEGDTTIAKLTDFGLYLSHHMAEGLSCTPPEGYENHTSKSDMYAFGIVSWEVVAEVCPWISDTDFLSLTSVKRGRRPPMEKWGATWNDRQVQLQGLVGDETRGCWAADPDARPTAREVCDKLCPTTSTADYITEILASFDEQPKTKPVDSSEQIVAVVDEETVSSNEPFLIDSIVLEWQTKQEAKIKDSNSGQESNSTSISASPRDFHCELKTEQIDGEPSVPVGTRSCCVVC